MEVKEINGKKMAIIEREDGTTVMKPYFEPMAERCLAYLDKMEAEEAAQEAERNRSKFKAL
ncbi:hypothetical protein FH966_00645 [Lentibacillus cibarius]|uniref:Uncharacterized protein n=1 Tax=Lentibacillus cibarius TaxID=2583219 RepID=A0A549YEN8_9BACI|nr:hypothetical protein [Lentibacillus cibarius]TRM10345.1 hypothetical protein FH966_00645 [Lentibacillus cibarius]